MLILHTLYYAFSRIIPGAINFLAVAVYTRLLTPDDYGMYAVVIALVGLGNVVLFQWIRLSLLRFYQAHREQPQKFLSTILFAFSLMFLLSAGGGGLLYFAWPDSNTRDLLLLFFPLVWASAWYELNLELFRSRLEPARYGVLSGLKAVVALICGTVLILLGAGVYGPLFGLLLGMLVATVGLGTLTWRNISWADMPLRVLKPYVAYGMPLMATFALAFIVSSSDRLIIAWIISKEAAGIYSAGYDLVSQVITLVMVTVNLAAYPMAIKVLEHSGVEAAQKKIIENGTLLLMVAVPITGIFFVSASQIVSVFLGIQYHDGAIALAPWIAVAAFIAGIRAYHFDLAFQLSQKTHYQVWVTGCAALANVVFNFIGISIFGYIGSAYATAAAYVVALVLSVFWGRRFFLIPLCTVENAKIFLSGGVMVLFLVLCGGGRASIAALIVQTSLAISIYLAVICLTNVLNVRQKILIFVKKK